MNPYFIAVAGPSGAGKSLFCRILQSQYSNVSRLKLDDFFKDLKDVPMIDGCVGEKCVLPAEVMLFDGFMTLVNPELRDLIDLKLYFDLSEDSQIKRRKIRQPWVENDYLNKIMIPAARQFIMPTKQYADQVINAEMLPAGVAEQCINIIHARFKQVKASDLEKSSVSHLYKPNSYQFSSINLKNTSKL